MEDSQPDFRAGQLAVWAKTFDTYDLMNSAWNKIYGTEQPSPTLEALSEQAGFIEVPMSLYTEALECSLAKTNANPVELALYARQFTYNSEEQAKRIADRLNIAIVEHMLNQYQEAPIHVADVIRTKDGWCITLSTLDETGRWEERS